MISWIGAGHLATAGLGHLDGRVRAITRTDARHPELRALGAEPSTTWPTLGVDDQVILSIPGSAGQAEAVERLRGTTPARAVLVSTTGLYGSYEGVITADAPPGDSERAQEAAATERAFRDWVGDRGVIVRLGGLYMAGRGPAAHFLRTGKARLAPGNAVLPLIHYDDAAALVLRALQPDVPPVLLGVVSTPTRKAFYEEGARRHGVSAPAYGPDGPEGTFHADVGRWITPRWPDWRAAW